MNRIERHKLARQVKRLSIILWVLMALIIILIIAFMATTIAGIYITILGVGLTTLAIVGVIPFSILITKQSKLQNEHKRIYKEKNEMYFLWIVERIKNDNCKYENIKTLYNLMRGDLKIFAHGMLLSAFITKGNKKDRQYAIERINGLMDRMI